MSSKRYTEEFKIEAVKQVTEQVWLGWRLDALRVLLSSNELNSLGPALLSRCVSICLTTPARPDSLLDTSVRRIGMILTAPPHASQ